jgi:hypothetical protein
VQCLSGGSGKIPKPITDASPTYSSVTFPSAVSLGAEIYGDLRLACRERQILSCNRMSVLLHLAGDTHSSSKGYASNTRGGAIEKFEKFRSESIINAVMAKQSQTVPTKVTTMEQVD